MVYKCSICGYVYDEAQEGKPFCELDACPICKQPPEKFVPQASEADTHSPCSSRSADAVTTDLSYPSQTRKTDSDYRYMKEIHEMAVKIGRAHV